MDSAPDVACAAIAVDRSSIAAQAKHPAPVPARARPGALACLLACALGGPFSLAASAARAQGPSPAAISAPEPQRATVSVPYDAAIAAYRAGRPDEALGVAERALDADPRNPQLRFLRGVVLAERGSADDAIAAFTSLAEDFPELAEPYNNLAVLHAQRGDWEAARQALEQSIRAVPGYALAHENLGDVHLQLAARAFERAGRLDAGNASARSKLGLVRELVARVQPLVTDSPQPRTRAQPQATPR
jgi:tetratricopeptide (TPR) repeat protein